MLGGAVAAKSSRIKTALLVETRVRPKLLTDLSPGTAKLIEDVTFDSKGRAVPKLYSKLLANKELRQMINIGAKEREQTVRADLCGFDKCPARTIDACAG